MRIGSGYFASRPKPAFHVQHLEEQVDIFQKDLGFYSTALNFALVVGAQGQRFQGMGKAEIFMFSALALKGFL